MSIADLPQEERPRERLVRSGVEALSLAELLAIFLATGTKGKSVINLAEEMLARFGGLQGLLDASIPELTEIKGIGQTKAIQLKAIFGLVLRSIKAAVPERYAIASPEHAFELARSEIGYHKQEALFVMLRDARGYVVHHEKVALGTLSEVLAHPREVFYPAVRHKAHSMIIAHNHPSGDPTPSQPDLELTKQLLHSSRILGIPIDDHLIVTSTAYTSLRARGYLGHNPLEKY